MSTKIAIVVQRYGVEVNGGAEQHARMVAERLALVPDYNVEVLTTCALEYTTWKNHYSEGVGEVNDIKVRRFKVEKTRNFDRFSRKSSKFFFEGRKFPGGEQGWLEAQGPYCPQCIDYIRENRNNYDVFIFFTYLYYTTVRGIAEVGDKAILVPTAHDEPPIYLGIYNDVFRAPMGFAFNTVEEREFLYGKFDIRHIPEDIFGVGVDIPRNPNPKRFSDKYGVSDYILYTGRIEDGKNCFELFDFFIRYKKQNPSGLKLVLMGKEVAKVPKHPDIMSLGFVSDEDRIDGMAGAKIFVLPSMNESLSIVVLESMSLGVPVVVNGRSEVLRGHCIRSNAGLYYEDYEVFEGCINYLLAPEHSDVYAALQENAREYVETNYRWDVIMEKYKVMINAVIS